MGRRPAGVPWGDAPTGAPSIRAQSRGAIRRMVMSPSPESTHDLLLRRHYGQKRQHLLEIDPRCTFEEVRHDRGPLGTTGPDQRLGHGHRPVGVRRLQHQILRVLADHHAANRAAVGRLDHRHIVAFVDSFGPDRTWLPQGRAASTCVPSIGLRRPDGSVLVARTRTTFRRFGAPARCRSQPRSAGAPMSVTPSDRP